MCNTSHNRVIACNISVYFLTVNISIKDLSILFLPYSFASSSIEDMLKKASYHKAKDAPKKKGFQNLLVLNPPSS